jgi:hypothetical protein
LRAGEAFVLLQGLSADLLSWLKQKLAIFEELGKGREKLLPLSASSSTLGVEN